MPFPGRRFLAVIMTATLPLWSQVAPIPAPSAIRGTNYFPATSITPDNVMAMLPLANTTSHAYGYNVPEAMFGEIERLSQSGLNNIRLISSFYAFLADRVAFAQCLRDLSIACRVNGIRITYIVWSAIGLTAAIPSRDGVNSDELWHELIGTDPVRDQCYEIYQGVTARTLTQHLSSVAQGQLPIGETIFGSLHHDPGNELIALSGDYTTWPFQIRRRIDDYLHFLANFFANDPDGQAAFAGYDLFNEPNGGVNLFNIPLSNYLDFIRTTHDILRGAHPGAAMTIGWAGAGPLIDQYDLQARAYGIDCDYLSCHSYAGPEVLRADAVARKAYATSIGRPLVISEFFRTDINAGTLRHLLKVLLDLQIGGQMWGFFQSNVFSPLSGGGFAPIDGVVSPVFHPAAQSPMSFDPINPTDLASVSAFGAGTLNPPPFTRVLVLDEDHLPTTAVVASEPFTVKVLSPRVGEPVYILASLVPPGGQVCLDPYAPTCRLVLGAGFAYVNPTTLIFAAGVVPANGTAVIFDATVMPPSAAGLTVCLQAYVGHGLVPAFAMHDGDLTWVSVFPIL